MGLNRIIAGVLRDAGMRDVFTVAVGAAIAPNPTVVLETGYERDGEYSGGERGHVHVQVLCVREMAAEAEEAALACEEAIRHGDWEKYAPVWECSVCSVDCAMPRFKGRDRSGRYVYELDVEVSVARDYE